MAKRSSKSSLKTVPKTTAKAKTKPAASGRHTLVPHLVCAGGAKAIAFYKKAFGATETLRLPTPDGRLMHASVMINGSPVMLVDESPQMCNFAPTTLKGTPVTIHLIVGDADAVIAKAAKAGAKVVMPAADMFWGDRYGVIEDPFGHRWSIATPIRKLSTAQIKQAAKGFMGK